MTADDEETGEITTETVEFNPWETPLGKLQLAIVPAKTGALNSVGVEILARADTSRRDKLRYTRHKQAPWEDGPSTHEARGFYVEAGMLYYYRTGVAPVALMPFYPEEDAPIVAEGFQELTERAQIRYGKSSWRDSEW